MASVVMFLTLTVIATTEDEITSFEDGYTAYWLSDALIESRDAYGPILLLSRTSLAQLKLRSEYHQTLGRLGSDEKPLLLDSAAIFLKTNLMDSI